MKRLFLVLAPFLFLANTLFAQGINLKNPLTKSDYEYLDHQAMECFGYDASVSFSINSEDFMGNKDKQPDKPSSLEEVKEFEKALKGNYRDASTYNNIGLVYRRLFKKEEALRNFNKSLELSKEWVKAAPDSAIPYDMLANAYVSLENYKEAARLFKKAHTIDKHDTISSLMMPMAFVFSGDFELAFKEIETVMKEDPDNIYPCVFWIICAYYQEFTELNASDKVGVYQLLKNKTPEEIIDFKVLKNVYELHRDNIQFELLYRVSRHLILNVKSLMLSFSDSTFSKENIKFVIDDKDKQELGELEAFYLSNLNNPKIPDKFILYKALGNLHLLLGETKAAIPFLEEAIKLKPLNKSQFDNNASEDYDNLAAAYFIMRDTVTFEKMTLKKFKIKPAIDPLPLDYIRMAKISFYHKDYAKAKEYATTALQMDEDQFEAYICLAAMDILQKNTKDAIKELDKAHKINPNSYSIWALMGIALLYDGDISTAYFAFDQAKNFAVTPKEVDDEIIDKFFTVRGR